MQPFPAIFLPILVLSIQVKASDPGDEDQQEDTEIGKRLYDFGLGKRAYRYVNEYKRLPMYEFGLGKRSKMYSFGLGKRSDEEYDEDIPELEIYDDNDMQDVDKRSQKMYSFGKRPLYGFGLGKRDKLYSFGLGKRGKMYSFGLGKRDDSDNNSTSSESQEETGGRALSMRNPTFTRQFRKPTAYSFGLGKREKGLYSFGLGKRA